MGLSYTLRVLRPIALLCACGAACSTSAGSPVDAGTSPDAPTVGVDVQSVPGWSVRKRLRSPAGGDLLVEEQLASYLEVAPGLSRVRLPSSGGIPERTWSPPPGAYLSDACRHPSGAVSAVLVGEDRAVSLARLDPDLSRLAVLPFHDPDIAGDPAPPEGDAPVDLRTSGLSFDAARMVCDGEDIVFVVNSESASVIVYRASFQEGAWTAARRTLVEPAGGLIVFEPTSGSFDTFEAISVSQRSFIDLDEDGNIYVAAYAQAAKTLLHAAYFQDGLTPLAGDPADPLGLDADVIVTQLDPTGARRWARLLGTQHEDQAYAIRAGGGSVAVVGRTRREPGTDNTTWDALIAVTASNGDPLGTRTLGLDASAILLAVDRRPTGGWVLAGSDGWSQNPHGLSVLSFGQKLLLELPALGDAPVRIDLPAGPRHNEVRSVVAGVDTIWLAGAEDGPVMHTGDDDRSQIRAVGVIGVVEGGL